MSTWIWILIAIGAAILLLAVYSKSRGMFRRHNIEKLKRQADLEGLIKLLSDTRIENRQAAAGAVNEILPSVQSPGWQRIMTHLQGELEHWLTSGHSVYASEEAQFLIKGLLKSGRPEADEFLWRLACFHFGPFGRWLAISLEEMGSDSTEVLLSIVRHVPANETAIKLALPLLLKTGDLRAVNACLELYEQDDVIAKDHAIYYLKPFLRSHLTIVSSVDLQKLRRLEDFTGTHVDYHVYCGELRELATAELQRRGEIRDAVSG